MFTELLEFLNSVAYTTLLVGGFSLFAAWGLAKIVENTGPYGKWTNKGE